MKLFDSSQLKLSGFGDCLPRALIGFQGEIQASRILRARGYKVIQASRKMGDLRAVDKSTGVIYRVEVKTANRAVDGKWRATLQKPGVDHNNADVVLFLAVIEDYELVPFVVPVAALSCRQLCITSHPVKTYRGKYAPYRQCVDTLDLEVSYEALD